MARRARVSFITADISPALAHTELCRRAEAMDAFAERVRDGRYDKQAHFAWNQFEDMQIVAARLLRSAQALIRDLPPLGDDPYWRETVLSHAGLVPGEPDTPQARLRAWWEGPLVAWARSRWPEVTPADSLTSYAFRMRRQSWFDWFDGPKEDRGRRFKQAYHLEPWLCLPTFALLAERDARVCRRIGDQIQRAGQEPPREPLSANSEAVLNLLLTLPIGSGMRGKEICTALDKAWHIGFLSMSVLTTRVVPELREWGLVSGPNGYSLPATSHARRWRAVKAR